MFIGNILAAPHILLASYGVGFMDEPVPTVWKIARWFSFLRDALEGIAVAIYDEPRNLICPKHMDLCILQNVTLLKWFTGFTDSSFWVSLAKMVFTLILLNLVAYYLLRQRLSPNYMFRKIKHIIKWNSVFTGPAVTVPLMLLAVYGIGYGDTPTPLIWQLARGCSFLRYGLEGLVVAIYGPPRSDLVCPDHVVYCEYQNIAHFVKMMGMTGVSYWVDFIVLVATLLAMNLVGYYLLRQRLSPNYAFRALKYIGRFIKAKMSGS